MDAATLAGPLIALLGTVVTAAIALWTSALLRRSESARKAAEIAASERQSERDQLREERGRLDAVSREIINELQEENSRLRSILMNWDKGCSG